MHKKEFLSLRKKAIILFDDTFSSHLSTEEGRIFYLLSKKLLNHINSFYTVLNGTNFNDVVENSEQIDHSSAKILLRASFESYLVMNHLFFEKPNLTEIRVLLYKHTGLKERQDKLPDKNLNFDLNAKKKEESELIKAIEASINNVSASLDLEQKYIRKALKEGWSAGNGWIQLGRKSSLANSYVETVYPYLCGYSHSGYESLMQLASDENSRNVTCRDKQSILYFYASYLLANFCKLYCSHTKVADNESVKKIGEIEMFLQKYRNIYS
ncbi:DUF5677 domain-containing protein [Psychromonas algicola]|uniref:DUF5677 domain-containing protein n=1 Tax=Psychromonas algicola TaxID=2555642 RepID=UPI0010673696|nr:DUF5677 domain-containing protein [Psychromonas sp. RZ5]TEW50231.1 hypothetical protein E2R67_09470 [Psychromonas sp. RZ5]